MFEKLKYGLLGLGMLTGLSGTAQDANSIGTVKLDSANLHQHVEQYASKFKLDNNQNNLVHDIANEYLSMPLAAQNKVDTTYSEPSVVSNPNKTTLQMKEDLLYLETIDETKNESTRNITSQGTELRPYTTEDLKSWLDENFESADKVTRTAFINGLYDVTGNEPLSVDESKESVPTESYPFAVGAGYNNFNGNSSMSLSGKVRLYDGDSDNNRLNVYGGATVNLTSGQHSDYSNEFTGDMRDTVSIPGTSFTNAERDVTKQKADILRKNIGDLSIAVEYEFNNGIAVFGGPSASIVTESYSNQEQQVNTETYSGPVDALTQDGYEPGEWKNDNFKTGGVSVLPGVNVGARYKQFSLEGTVAGDNNNLKGNVSLLYHFGGNNE